MTSQPHPSTSFVAPPRKTLHQRLRAVVLDTWTQMQECQLPSIASSLAYTTLLSIIPLLAVSFSIFKAFGGMEKLYETIEPFILDNLAEGVSDEAMIQVRLFISNIHAGAVGGIGIVGLLFTCMALLTSADTAIQRVWKVVDRRKFFHRMTSYWFFITLGPVAASVALGFAGSSQSGLGRLIPSGVIGTLLVTAFFFGIYKWVPNRRVHWRPALIGGAFAAIGFQLAKVGYGLYVKHVVNYDKIYGSLGAIPIFLIWIYVMWLVVLTGSALSAALQRRFETT